MSRTRAFKESEVLEKALETFLDKGFESTSISDLVAATKVNRQSLYNTFGVKRALYIRALRAYCTAKYTPFTEILLRAAPVSGVLDEMRDKMKAMMADPHAGLGCLLVNSLATSSCRHDGEIKEMISEVFARRDQGLEALFQRGQKGGEITPKHTPKALAQTFHAAFLGLEIQARNGVPREEMERIVDVMFDTVLVRRS